MNAAVEQDVAASRMVKILAEDEPFDEGGDAVKLGLVSQNGDVDACGRDLLRSQEVEDEREEFRIAIDENRPRIVFQTRDAPRQ